MEASGWELCEAPVTTQLLPPEKGKQRTTVWEWKGKLPGAKMVAKVFLSGCEKAHLE